MALDGIFLHCLQQEIADGAVGDRVDKIHQPTKEEIVLTLRGRSGAKKLLCILRIMGRRTRRDPLCLPCCCVSCCKGRGWTM